MTLTNTLDTVCLFGTYLDSFVSTDAGILPIPGYSSVRADHLSNVKRVLKHFKNYLPLKLIDVKYLHECISFGLKIGGKSCI